MADLIKVLILEDVLLDAELAMRELENEGINFNSIIVEDREDYIKELKNFKPDIILADHSLPQFDGISALNIKKEVSPDTPFIFVSGKIGEEFAVEMLKEGATDYVLKNNLIKLGPAVKRALKEAQEYRANRIAQAALLENEEKYRALFERSINPILVLDENGYCLDFNRSALEFFENINIKSSNKHINELLTFDIDLEPDNAFWKRGGSFEAFYHFNNTTKYLDISFNPVKIRNTLTIFGIAKDLTSQKKAEILLKEKEEEYRLLIENQTDFIIKFDLEGNLRFVSPSYCEILGRKESELLNESFIPLIHEEDRVKTDKAIDLLFKPPYTSYLEHRVQTKHGWRWIAWSYKAIIDKNNKVSGFVGVGRDINDQIRAQKALKESEIKYRSIFENTGAMTMLFNQDMKIILVNSEFEKFSGYPKKAVEGKRNVSDFVYAEDISRIEGYHRMQRINPDAIPKNYEVQLVNRNGQVKDFFATFDMIPDTDKGIISFMDITDRKIAENKIKKSLREKELLLREIHHRVKNNLQIISSLMSLQSEYTKEPETLKMFQESKNRIRSMALIHEKLYQSEDMAHIDFAEYLKSLVEMFLTFYKEKKEDITVSLNCDAVYLEIDTAISMGLIVNELLSNCFKHAFPGEKTGEIKINLSKNQENYLLEVADDGVGLPEDITFENSESLGLQIVQTLTLQLKGSLGLENVKGTRFKLVFPDKSMLIY